MAVIVRLHVAGRHAPAAGSTVLVPAASGGGTVAVDDDVAGAHLDGGDPGVVARRLGQRERGHARRRSSRVERGADGAAERRRPRRRRVAVGGCPAGGRCDPGQPPVGDAPARSPARPRATSSEARWSRRTVTSASNERSSGSSTSRTSAGSGSDRQRSVGRVRSRVSTNDDRDVRAGGGDRRDSVGRGAHDLDGRVEARCRPRRTRRRPAPRRAPDRARRRRRS